MFAKNLTIIVKEQQWVSQHVLSRRLYGTHDETQRRRIRRLMNERIRPTLDVVIMYARALDVHASDLAFKELHKGFNAFVEVEDRFAANLALYEKDYSTFQMAIMLYPNKRVIDKNDERKLRRLVQGVTKPRLDDIVNLANGLGVHPGVLCFGVCP